MLLQQPGRMGPLRLKNRVVMGPMGTNFGTTDGFSTERDKIYYAERARGGAAMIITEAMVVSGNARNHRASLCIFDDRFIPGLADLTKAVHQAGCSGLRPAQSSRHAAAPFGSRHGAGRPLAGEKSGDGR